MTQRGLGVAALCALLALVACSEPGTYPVSGEECGPDDPVKQDVCPPNFPTPM